MEAFSLLKYWRGGGGAAAISASASASAPAPARSAVSITTIAASALPSAGETDDESGDGDGDDEGPFFDLEFAVPDEECDGDGNEELEEEEEEEEDDGSCRGGEEREEATDDEAVAEEREFNFTVSSEGSCGDLRADPSLPLSPSDDLFFKGRLVPLESSSLVFNPAEAHARPHILPVSLLKTKFRVLMLGLRRPKHAPAAAPVGELLSGASVPAAAPSPKHPQQRQSKLFTVKFKVEEVPIVSLFTRDNSSRSTGSISGRASKQQADECGGAPAASAGEKKLSKELVHKYLNKIKPLYVRVSKRYAEKLRFSGQLSAEGVIAKEQPPAQSTSPPSAAGSAEVEAKGGEACSAPDTAPSAPSSAAKGAVQKPAQMGNLPAGLRVVCKHLGKSRSASAAVAAVPSPPPTLTRRRDDSLLQQQDGIQSAIAHCKMSFNASKESDACVPPSSKSEASIDGPRTCCDRAKEDCV